MRQHLYRRIGGLIFITVVMAACDNAAWNNPYPTSEDTQNILYSSFSERPKHLDPAQSYSSNEYEIHGQIYEPPLQYHYLKRPYTLEPLTAEAIPQPKYYDNKGEQVSEKSPALAFSVYEIRIKPGILFQPHPAFAKDAQGQLLYHHLTESDLSQVQTIQDFKQTGTRELVAADYVYQIKRLAHPKLHSPILSFMNDYIVGLDEYAKTLSQAYQSLTKLQTTEVYLDLNQFQLAGVQIVDRYTYQIKIRGKYPQLVYWLAMPFFAPVPAEVDHFYSQPGMRERNFTLDWYPVGTGAYMLTKNNPNRQMVLERNPNYHADYYPTQGEEEDTKGGLLADAGKQLPFIDKAIFSLEKESIPYWSKFLQGYYDASGIISDSFDQAVQFSTQGDVQLTPALEAQGIRLVTTVQTSTSYMGFNMLDEVVGGSSVEKQKLRQAISIAIDYEEYISIFRNGRGIAAQNPVPPGIFGHLEGKEGINSYVYDWLNGQAKRKSIEEAKRLLAEAGYPNGRDRKTGASLLIHFDTTAGGPEDKAMLDWITKQFAKIDVQFVARNTDYNRFQEKMRKGNAQLFMWGWNADYPDPENFLFLLYGPNAKAKHGGENAANYDNPEFNRLFEQMKNMQDGPQRLAIINRMLEIVRRDAPWVWGFYPKQFGLYQQWLYNSKPNLMAHNGLKYKRIDAHMRQTMRQQWNTPILWPVVLIVLLTLLSLIPAIRAYRHKEYASAILRNKIKDE